MHCRGECDVPGCRATLRLHIDLARAHYRHVASLRQGKKSRSKAPGRCLALVLGREVRPHPVDTLLVTGARVCARWSLASNSSTAVRKVKQTRVIFPFSSTSTSHLPSQTNSRDHNRRAINNGCLGGRLFLMWPASSSGCCNPAGARIQAAY